MSYKRKYHRGQRITSFEELLEQRLVYLSAYDNRTKSIEVVKCMMLGTVMKFLDCGMIYKAIPGEGPDEVTAIGEPLEGQTNIFTGEEDEHTS